MSLFYLVYLLTADGAPASSPEPHGIRFLLNGDDPARRPPAVGQPARAAADPVERAQATGVLASPP